MIKDFFETVCLLCFWYWKRQGDKLKTSNFGLGYELILSINLAMTFKVIFTFPQLKRGRCDSKKLNNSLIITCVVCDRAMIWIQLYIWFSACCCLVEYFPGHFLEMVLILRWFPTAYTNTLIWLPQARHAERCLLNSVPRATQRMWKTNPVPWKCAPLQLKRGKALAFSLTFGSQSSGLAHTAFSICQGKWIWLVLPLFLAA